MKALPCIAVLSLSVLGLSACKTMDEKSAYVAPAPAASQSGMKNQARFEDDAAYIAYVERNARRRGIYLQWVNKPQKRVVDSQ